MTGSFKKLELIIVAVAAVVLLVVLPVLNAQGIISNFAINLWGKYLSYAILAISIDLLWATRACSVSGRRSSSVLVGTC
jgi:urea transport system permease protein